MTVFALGMKSSGFTTPFDCRLPDWAAPSSRGFSKEFNAASPMPADVWPRNVLRVAARARSSIMVLIPRIDFVKVQNHSRYCGHRRQKRRALIAGDGNFAYAQQI